MIPTELRKICFGKMKWAKRNDAKFAKQRPFLHKHVLQEADSEEIGVDG